MISTSGISVNFGGTPLFEDVNIKFVPGNCYGLIGANGAGKSTFLKVLSGDLESSAGVVNITPGQRIGKLEQDQFKYDAYTVIDTVMMGFPELYKISKAREVLYSKPDFTEEDGALASELEMKFADINGYEAEADVSTLLAGLGVPQELHYKMMSELEGGEKVRVLLAQALFGKPDILLLDEPTNNLDVHTVSWLEEYLQRQESLVIVISHDRHFLNNVCTHIADIDFRKIKIYVGNYDFWFQAAQLALQQRRDEAKKSADKAKDLKAFIERFSSNASKAKQATSRRKLLDQLTLDDLPISTRKYPHIVFKCERNCGKAILTVKNLSKTIDGEKVIENLSFTVHQGDRIALVGQDGRAKSTLFEILCNGMKPDSGTVEWGSTITVGYFPKENDEFFKDCNLNLIDWLRQYTKDQTEEHVRSFLGRMLFSGEDTQKPAKVLSGGERVRCMLSRIMQQGANALVLDEPTNHLDLESITALNNALRDFHADNVVLFTSHDRELVNTVANRIFEMTPNGLMDRYLTFDEYIASEQVNEERAKLYGHEVSL
ncbi:MAG: ATP-binding cassette domain-containing protein [bacterium]